MFSSLSLLKRVIIILVPSADVRRGRFYTVKPSGLVPTKEMVAMTRSTRGARRCPTGWREQQLLLEVGAYLHCKKDYGFSVSSRDAVNLFLKCNFSVSQIILYRSYVIASQWCKTSIKMCANAKQEKIRKIASLYLHCPAVIFSSVLRNMVLQKVRIQSQ